MTLIKTYKQTCVVAGTVLDSSFADLFISLPPMILYQTDATFQQKFKTSYIKKNIHHISCFYPLLHNKQAIEVLLSFDA